MLRLFTRTVPTTGATVATGPVGAFDDHDAYALYVPLPKLLACRCSFNGATEATGAKDASGATGVSGPMGVSVATDVRTECLACVVKVELPRLLPRARTYP